MLFLVIYGAISAKTQPPFNYLNKCDFASTGQYFYVYSTYYRYHAENKSFALEKKKSTGIIPVILHIFSCYCFNITHGAP